MEDTEVLKYRTQAEILQAKNGTLRVVLASILREVTGIPEELREKAWSAMMGGSKKQEEGV